MDRVTFELSSFSAGCPYLIALDVLLSLAMIGFGRSSAVMGVASDNVLTVSILFNGGLLRGGRGIRRGIGAIALPSFCRIGKSKHVDARQADVVRRAIRLLTL